MSVGHKIFAHLSCVPDQQNTEEWLNSNICYQTLCSRECSTQHCLLIIIVFTDDHLSQSSNGFGNRGNINTVAKCKTLPPSQGITIKPIKYIFYSVIPIFTNM